jgi:hypothetical protein
MKKLFLIIMILCSLLIFSCAPKHKVTKTPGTIGFKEELCYITLINDSKDNMEIKIEPFDSTEPIYQQLLSPGHKVLIQLPKADYDLYYRMMNFNSGTIGEWQQKELLLSYKRKCKAKVRLGSSYFHSPYYDRDGGGLYHEDLR